MRDMSQSGVSVGAISHKREKGELQWSKCGSNESEWSKCGKKEKSPCES